MGRGPRPGRNGVAAGLESQGVPPQGRADQAVAGWSAKNLYERLRVEPDAEPHVVRAAYYALARRLHPDAGGDARAMTMLNAAWAVLRDPASRAAYDAELARRTGKHTARSSPGPASDRTTSNGRPFDTTSALDFGRYAGWTLAEVAVTDPGYVQWLIRTPIGRRFAAEAGELLKSRAAARPAGYRRPGTVFSARQR